MMIGGGIQEIPAVKIIQKLGYKVLVTDRNANAPCFSIADYTFVCDGRDVESLVAFAILYGGIVLAFAIAFGVGGKDAAKNYIDKRIKGEEEKDEIQHL